MFFENLAHAMAGTGAGAGGQAQNPIASFLPLIIMFAIFYFLLIRPQQKKAKQHRELLSALKKGDNVLTSGGLYGRIVSVADDVLTIDLGGDVKVKVNRAFVQSLTELAPKGETKKDKNPEDKK